MGIIIALGIITVLLLFFMFLRIMKLTELIKGYDTRFDAIENFVKSQNATNLKYSLGSDFRKDVYDIFERFNQSLDKFKTYERIEKEIVSQMKFKKEFVDEVREGVIKLNKKLESISDKTNYNKKDFKQFLDSGFYKETNVVFEKINNSLEKFKRIDSLLLYNKKILTFEDVLVITGFASSYLYKLVNTHAIPYSKPTGGKVFFDREELESWILKNVKEFNEKS